MSLPCAPEKQPLACVLQGKQGKRVGHRKERNGMGDVISMKKTIPAFVLLLCFLAGCGSSPQMKTYFGQIKEVDRRLTRNLKELHDYAGAINRNYNSIRSAGFRSPGEITKELALTRDVLNRITPPSDARYHQRVMTDSIEKAINLSLSLEKLLKVLPLSATPSMISEITACRNKCLDAASRLEDSLNALAVERKNLKSTRYGVSPELFETDGSGSFRAK